MKRLLVIGAAVAVASAILYLVASRRRGPAQEAGRKLDEAIEKVQHGDETKVQKASRKLKEAAEGVRKEIKV